MPRPSLHKETVLEQSLSIGPIPPRAQRTSNAVQRAFTAVRRTWTAFPLSFTAVKLACTAVKLANNAVHLMWAAVQVAYTAVEMSFTAVPVADKTASPIRIAQSPRGFDSYSQNERRKWAANRRRLLAPGIARA